MQGWDPSSAGRGEAGELFRAPISCLEGNFIIVMEEIESGLEDLTYNRSLAMKYVDWVLDSRDSKLNMSLDVVTDRCFVPSCKICENKGMDRRGPKLYWVSCKSGSLIWMNYNLSSHKKKKKCPLLS